MCYIVHRKTKKITMFLYLPECFSLISMLLCVIFFEAFHMNTNVTVFTSCCCLHVDVSTSCLIALRNNPMCMLITSRLIWLTPWSTSFSTTWSICITLQIKSALSLNVRMSMASLPSQTCAVAKHYWLMHQYNAPQCMHTIFSPYSYFKC